MIPVPEQILNKLAQAYAVAPGVLLPFGGVEEEGDGVIYAFFVGAEQRLLKVMAIPTEDRQRGLFRLEERMRFAHYLASHGAPVVQILPSPTDRLFETTEGDEFVWVAYAMKRAAGWPIRNDTWNEELFGRWGQAVGRMHHLATEYPSWQSSPDPETGQEFLTWREELQGFIKWTLDDEVKAKWLEMEQTLSALPVSRDAFGFIHNDPHGQNILVDGKTITVIDFDVANHHWFANDIAVSCQSVLLAHAGGFTGPLRDADKVRFFLEAFMAGYAREHTLAEYWLDRLDIFIAYRRLLLFTVMQGYLADKTEIRDTWKAMILAQPTVVGEWKSED